MIADRRVDYTPPGRGRERGDRNTRQARGLFKVGDPEPKEERRDRQRNSLKLHKEHGGLKAQHAPHESRGADPGPEEEHHVPRDK